MKESKEIEIKFAIADLRAVRRRLKAAGFRQVTRRTHEMNTLYDAADQRLRNRGELLRLRKYGREWVLTHKEKGSTGLHKVRVETETTVEDGACMERILQALGLTASFRYEKFRAEWSQGAGHVVLDETPIGNFGEIEGPARWIDRTARALGIKPADYITQNYAGLFLEWKARTGSPAREMLFAQVKRSRAVS